MYFFEIDEDKKTPSLNLSLAKPNLDIIGNLVEVGDRDGKFSFGQFNEITFTIPKFIVRKHKKVLNKNYINMRERYLVKADYGHLLSEWMIVTNISKVKDEIPKKKVTIKSRQIELNDKRLRNYEAESYRPFQVMGDALRYTNWRVGHIDGKLEAIYRSFDETDITVLNMLYKIAETYKGILEFDTINQIINLRDSENIEVDLGLTATYGKYIKSVQQDSDPFAMVTRLSVYGKDDISINSINPTGASYLEDFSYFMEGYETDAKGNVVSSSPYMSDSLCQAIIDYSELVNSKEGVFKKYLDDRQPIYDKWIERASELYALEIDLAIIEDKLDIAKAMESDKKSLERDKTDKIIEINNKQKQVDDLDEELTLIELDIEYLREELDLENNFTSQQIAERNYYIIDGEWSDRNYFDVDDLYEQGAKILKKRREPEMTLDFSLIQFLDVVEAQRDWNRIGLGYVMRVDYTPLDIEFKALITEFNIGFDSQDLKITVSNVDYKSDRKKFLELLYGTAVSTSQKFDMESIKWDESSGKTTEMEKILEGAWDAASRRILAGVNESVTFDGRGLRIVNPDFPNEMLIGQAGVLALSKNGGQDWQTAISPDGIVAERLLGRIIMGQNLIMENENQEMRFDGDGLTITRSDNKIKTHINATDGIKIQRNFGSGFEDVFYADIDGILYARGLIIDESSVIGGYEVGDIVDSGVGDIIDDNINGGIPYKPSGISANGAFETITVSWSFNSVISLSHYEVHASKERNFIPDSKTLVYAGKAQVYSHKSNTDETWYFRVRAISIHGRPGSYSDQASASTAQIYDFDLAVGSVISEKIADLAVIAEKIAEEGVTRGKIAEGAVNNEKLDDLAITAEKLADGAVVDRAIFDGAVGSAKLADLAVVSAKIDQAAINEAHISDAAIGNAAIQNAAIDAAKIAEAAIGQAHIEEAAIQEAHIANLAVGNAAIQNVAITNSKIENSAITTAKIEDAAITSAKIARLAVDTAHIADASITNAKMARLSVGSAQIENGAITNAKIHDLSAKKITTGVLEGINITGSLISGSVFRSEKDSQNFTEIRGGYLVSRGRYSRTWKGQTTTQNVRLMLQEGQFRARNDDLNWSLYFNDWGISTFSDGDGDGSDSGASGVIEFHSNKYSPTWGRTGLTLASIAGRLALETENSRIYLNPNGASVQISDRNDNFYGVSASNFSQSSSQKLKRNIKTLHDNALELINSLDIKEYKRLTRGESTVEDRWQAGIIVEESPAQFLADGNSLDLYTMLAYTMKAVQELTTRLGDR